MGVEVTKIEGRGNVMDFVCYEEAGFPITRWGRRFRSRDGLREGMRVRVPTLWDPGWMRATVERRGTGWRAVAGDLSFMLAWRDDYHGSEKCWTCIGIVNERALDKVEFRCD